jgi:hypothetical protein
MTELLPVEPLVPFIPQPVPTLGDGNGFRLGGTANLPESIQQAIYRAKRAGAVSVFAADRIACALGHHPVEIWPDWYEAGEDA